MQTTSPSGEPDRAACVPLAMGVALVAVAVAMRWWTAVHSWGLGQDACSFLETARGLLDGRVGADWWPFRMKHAAYPVVIAAGGAIGLELEVAARAVSIVASALLTALVYRTWTRWRGAAEGTVAGLLVAVHPGLALYGGEVWVEPLQMLLLFVLFRAALRIWETPAPLRHATWIGLGFGMLASLKSNAVFFVPGAAIAILVPRTKSLRVAQVLRVGAVFTLVFVVTALSSQIAEFLVRGAVTPIGAGGENPSLLEEGDRWAFFASPGTPGRTAAILHSNFVRLGRDAIPRFLAPVWIIVPLAAAGLVAVIRDGGPARRFAWIAGLSILVEWVCMAFYAIQDRYLLFGFLWLFPVCAAGVTELGRRASSIGAAGRALGPAVLVVLVALWGRSFFISNAANGANVNGYRAAGLALRRAATPPPRRLLTVVSEVAWHAQVERAAMETRTADATLAAMESLGCAGLVVGAKEVSVCPDLDPLRALPVGGEWRGLTVIVRIEGEDPVSVLAR